jgi:hypothetical protein
VSWTLQTQEINGVEFSLFFHLASQDIPLLIGHEILQNSVVNFNHHPFWVDIKHRNTIFRFPIHTHEQRNSIEIDPIHHSNILSSHVLLGDAEDSHIARDHFATAAHENSPKAPSASQVPPHLVAERLHSYSNAPLRDLCKFFQRAGMLTKEIESDLRKFIADYDICAQVGRPTPSRKVSPGRVVAEFNQTKHIDFMFITISDTSVILLHIVDSDTAFFIALSVPTRDLWHAGSQFEENWIFIHGASSSLAADPEFARVHFNNILDKHHILFAERPARRHQKTGCVERKNGVLRVVTRF